MLTKFFRKKASLSSKAPISSHAQVDATQSYHLMTADQLIHTLNLYNQLRNIRRLVSMGDRDYESLYLMAIHRFLECCQLIPASGSYHHTAPGGLIVHTLNMIEHAIDERSRFFLPKFSDPAIQQAQRHVWTYAVFVASLLHDAGKSLTQQQLQLSNGTIFNPFNITIDSNITYTLTFNNAPNAYRLHQQIASLYYGILIPKRGQLWLAQHLPILDELTATIQGNHTYSGTIGEIIQKSDSRSVSESLGFANTERFLGATPPISEKIIMAIRHLAPSFGVNHPSDGAFKKDGIVWILSKILADSVRDYLKIHNEVVPNDNNRIFDELQQSGFPLMNALGIVHFIEVKIDDWSKVFSVIGFDVRKIYDPAQMPGDCQGSITIVEKGYKNAEDGEAIPSVVASTKVHKKTTEASSPYDLDAPGDSMQQTDQNVWQLPGDIQINSEATSSANTHEDEASSNSVLDEFGLPIEVKNNEDEATDDIPDENAAFEATEIEDGSGLKPWQAFPLPPFPPKTSLNSYEGGLVFIEWLKLMIKHRRYEVNDKSSPVHKVSETHLGLLSPRIFLDFADAYQFKDVKEPHNKIRNGLNKTGALEVYNKNQQIFPAKFVDQDIQINFCLIREKVVNDQGLKLPINPTIRVPLLAKIINQKN